VGKILKDFPSQAEQVQGAFRLRGLLWGFSDSVQWRLAAEGFAIGNAQKRIVPYLLKASAGGTAGLPKRVFYR